MYEEPRVSEVVLWCCGHTQRKKKGWLTAIIGANRRQCHLFVAVNLLLELIDLVIDLPVVRRCCCGQWYTNDIQARSSIVGTNETCR